jgi:opacity protein-like surface antigen
MRKSFMPALLGAAAFAAALTHAPTAAAEADLYVGVAAGWLRQNDSDNAGRTGAFSTGNGAPAVPTGTAVAAGTPYGWSTEFDDGYTVSAEAGFFYGSGLRSGIEIVHSKADVDRHSGVRLGAATLDGVDAAVLTGSATQLGATVGQVLSRDDGEISHTALFANAYYDFNREGAIRPYVGAGVGVSKVDVQYSPSGVGVIDGDDTKFAWQGKAGVTWAFSDALQFYGEYAYRATEDITLTNRLFPGSLDIENEQHAVSIGLRFKPGLTL